MIRTVEAKQPFVPESVDLVNRAWHDTETWCAEVLNGSMRTSFEFYFDGEELYAEDGGCLGDIFNDAIETAKELSIKKPELAFEQRRREIEASEYKDMLSMGRGDAPNTMVVISDYPMELMDKDESIGGYNGQRKQTMMRVITRLPDNKIRMVTQSLDGSNRKALEAIYEHFGLEADPGELLSQRIYTNLGALDQEFLPSHLTKKYDDSLTMQTGMAHHAGIMKVSNRTIIDTYTFVKAQNDIIQWFVDHKLSDSVGAEKLRFKLAAVLDKRYEDMVAQKNALEGQNLFVARTIYDSVEVEVNHAMRQAIIKKKSFNGCGVSVMDDSFEDVLKEGTGLGNKTDETCTFVSKSCPLCNRKNVKTTSIRRADGSVTVFGNSGGCKCRKNYSAPMKT